MELFSRDGIGTMVTQHSLENLRQATIEDVGGLLQIIEPLEEQGILVKRGREVLETEIGNFALLEHDGIIIGCAALYKFPDQASAELACLAVTPDFRSAGRGERLLNHMEKLAAAQNIKKLFVLSTRTMHFFLERGFTETDLSQLPEKKQMLYNYERRSKIFLKSIGA
jgi:amino-acid N-acetyltransferase